MLEYLCNSNSSKIPKNTTHLIFKDDFNRKVNNLPNLITHLTFGWKFNYFNITHYHIN